VNGIIQVTRAFGNAYLKTQNAMLSASHLCSPPLQVSLTCSLLRCADFNKNAERRVSLHCVCSCDLLALLSRFRAQGLRKVTQKGFNGAGDGAGGSAGSAGSGSSSSGAGSGDSKSDSGTAPAAATPAAPPAKFRPYLSAIPEVDSDQITEDTLFLIIASDGCDESAPLLRRIPAA
jgi:hypothetical protein